MDAFAKIKELFENTQLVITNKEMRCNNSSCSPYHIQKSKIQYQSNYTIHQIFSPSKKE